MDDSMIRSAALPPQAKRPRRGGRRWWGACPYEGFHPPAGTFEFRPGSYSTPLHVLIYECLFGERRWSDVDAWIGTNRSIATECASVRDGFEEIEPLLLCLRGEGPSEGDPPEETMRVVVGLAPWVAGQDYCFGSLPLHVAAYEGYSEGILDLLANAYPEALLRREAAGQTPLHLALVGRQWNAAKFLVRRNPAPLLISDEDGCLPLHRAAERGAPADLLSALVDDADPKFSGLDRPTLTSRDRNGRTPLHAYVRFNGLSSVDAMKTLSDDPSVLRVKDGDGLTPLQSLWTGNSLVWGGVFMEFAELREAGSRPQNEELPPGARKLWGFTETLLRAERDAGGSRTEDGNDDASAAATPFRVLPAALEHSDRPYFVMLRVALRACDPDRAKREAAMRDGRGRPFLHRALAAGVRWENGLAEIVRLCPEALRACDGQVGSSPVFAAATSSDQDLNTLYQLILSEPATLVNHFKQE